jgi:predicted DNA-binding transcriptional regulator AlpA
MTASPILLTSDEAARLLGISKRTFHNLRHADGFPKPLVLSERIVRWRAKDIEAFIAALRPSESCQEPDQLRKVRLDRRRSP